MAVQKVCATGRGEGRSLRPRHKQLADNKVKKSERQGITRQQSEYHTPRPKKKQSKWINGLSYKTKTQQNNKGCNVLCVGVRYNDSYRVKNEERG